MLQVEPGHASQALCNRNECTGFDHLTAVQVGLVFAAIALGSIVALPLVLVFMALAACFGLLVVAPFQACERLARARIRRGECKACGAALAKVDGEGKACPQCGQ